jgi:lysophospholipase L1-like esterase
LARRDRGGRARRPGGRWAAKATAALALAALAVLPAGCGGDGSDGETVAPTDHLVVSLGDSVASGEGNPDRAADFPRRAEWTVRRCHRSMRSGHALAARRLIGPEDPGRAVLLGCSGATVDEGLLGPYAGIEPDGTVERAQVEVLADLARGRSVDAVLVSIGANDVGFSRIVQFCILNLGGPCWEDRFDPEPGEAGPRVPLEEHVPQAIAALAQGYRRLHRAISAAVPDERVIVVEYFDPTGGAGGEDCEMFFGGVTRTESRWAREHILGPLNRQIRESAEDFGWRYVDGVDERFREHGLCAGPERWVVTARESIFDLGIPLGGSPFDPQTHRELLASYKGTLHPNPEGHQATAELIFPVLEEVVEGTG